jgi:hypothetical protein
MHMQLRRRIISWLLAALNWMRPKQDLRPVVNMLAERAAELARRNDDSNREAMEWLSELVEARAMAGSGPWSVGPSALAATDRLIAAAQESLRTGAPLREIAIREAIPPISAGAFGDIELALQNVEWRREVNFSWLEFSRWGIQQIILITRLYYIKNPIIRRLIDVGAAYVFARGLEISSPEDAVNEEIDRFVAANPKVLGHIALMKLERRKDYDGNLFFAFFEDTADKGTTRLRTIDATEIEEIATDPDDTDSPWYYHRCWSQRVFDPTTGATKVQAQKKWYPALGYDPTAKPDTIRGDEVVWDTPVYHSKCGDVAKWTFGCPRAYPALDWSKEARRLLEACASVKQSNAQIAREITTKGGQQAIEGMKSQLQTTVGPSSQIWDQNPPAVTGATWVSGPGTKLELMKMRGASDDPEEVRRYLLMCCMVFGVPETFLGDVSTGNLATATSLDRPTETVMLEKQEAWREDLMVIVLRHLNTSKKAPSGKLREALEAAGLDPGKVRIRECQRVRSADGTRMEYAKVEKRIEGKVINIYEAGRKLAKTELIVRVNFPAIREGDLKTLVEATVQGATMGNRAGQFIGTDEKETVRHLYDLLDYDNGDELVEEQYPESEYDRDRTTEVLPPPIARPPVGLPGGVNPARAEQPDDNLRESQALRAALTRLDRATKAYEAAGRNGHG